MPDNNGEENTQRQAAGKKVGFKAHPDLIDLFNEIVGLNGFFSQSATSYGAKKEAHETAMILYLATSSAEREKIVSEFWENFDKILEEWRICRENFKNSSALVHQVLNHHLLLRKKQPDAET